VNAPEKGRMVCECVCVIPGVALGLEKGTQTGKEGFAMNAIKELSEVESLEVIIEEIVRRYEAEEGMLIPMLQDIQAVLGYLPMDHLRLLSKRLVVPLARIYSVATFYASFRLAPKGQHDVTLCMGTVCYLKGSGRVSEAISEEFGVQPGGTTSDRLFTLNLVNCVGCCAVAPVMVVDGKYHGNLTPDLAVKTLRRLGAETGAGAGGEPDQAKDEGASAAKPAVSKIKPAAGPGSGKAAAVAKKLPSPKKQKSKMKGEGASKRQAKSKTPAKKGSSSRVEKRAGSGKTPKPPTRKPGSSG
jgi:NADH-quinone oxidoreductase subunit E